MERESSKHGPRLDEEQKRETKGIVRGGGPTHAEEWKETEPMPAPGEEASVRRYAPGHEPGTPEGISAEAVDLRSDLAKWLSDADFPASARDLRGHAERMDAPDEVTEILRSLPEGRYINMAEVGQALGLGVEKRRW
ncbi:DUF2795 domain-containing protein [Nonomuraea sp. LPB2021202275-12-8]|uniref:DUF2795 domain-containing protein n=1 Tax=Nonomuraea sp. LPB2021202275-12-8 TaxID=3120159 RepID=UPI00300D77EE